MCLVGVGAAEPRDGVELAVLRLDQDAARCRLDEARLLVRPKPARLLTLPDSDGLRTARKRGLFG